MNISELMQDDNYDVRVTLGNRWFVYNTLRDMFVVYERKPYAKKIRVLMETHFECKAVEELTKGA